MRGASRPSSASATRCCVRAASLLPLAVLLGALACQSRTGFAPGLSGMRTELRVIGSERLGPYLAAELARKDDALDAYVLPSESCLAVFEAGATVTYVDTGPQGVYRRGEASCQGLGVGHLLVWRDRDRHSAGTVLPRTQVAYRVIHRGERFTLLRGQFPGAARIGFTGQGDLVAVVPTGGECAAIVEQRAASMEYRDKGSRTFSLVGPNGLCEIHGFAQPPPQVAAPEAQ